ncbi:DMT family transporter [Pseudodesulfovibrio tunisiensis]|uniref:DMT family transporter n=1 Tax=Pseudodesulfovibrio tunisiensis TaxID=463192 RepID=UPI0024368912|nr:DMT family transporter [Pseudodesulfovibrio tunisiensis]
MNRAFSGYGFVILASFCWSLMTLLSRNLFAAGLAPLEISFWRAFLGCLCFGIHAVCLHSLRIRPSRALLFMVWGMFGVGGLYYVLFMSMRHSGAAMGEILLYTAPVWVAVFSRFISHEEVSKKRWLAIGTALCGVIFLAASGGSMQTEPSLPGILCGVASGLCYGLQYPFLNYWQRKYETEVIYAYMQLGGALVLLPFITFHVPYTAQTWLDLAMTAVFTGYMAFWAYGQSLKRIPQVHVAVFCNLEPILGTIWVCVFWGENFSVAGWIGFSLIILAVSMLALELRRNGVSKSMDKLQRSVR